MDVAAILVVTFCTLGTQAAACDERVVIDGRQIPEFTLRVCRHTAGMAVANYVGQHEALERIPYEPKCLTIREFENRQRPI